MEEKGLIICKFLLVCLVTWRRYLEAVHVVVCLSNRFGFWFGKKCIWGVTYVFLLSIPLGSRIVKEKQSKCVETTRLYSKLGLSWTLADVAGRK